MGKRLMVWLIPAFSLLGNPSGAEAQYRYYGRPWSGYYSGGPGYYGGYGIAPAGYGTSIAPSYGGSYYPYSYSPALYGYSYLPDIPYIWVLETAAAPRMRATMWPAVQVEAASITPATYTERAAIPATIEITLPAADAEIFFDGIKTSETGLVRKFVTPALDPTSSYTYELRICWKTSSGPQEHKRTISFRAGDRLRLDITGELLPPPRKN